MTKTLATVSSKRQITLPIDLCREVGITPGDKVKVFIHDGQITLMKQRCGAAEGALAKLEGDISLSDEASLLDALEQRDTSRNSTE
ncbi:AbrB/MazE/SpoVT family DNA-binding domain-containing protein [Pistricoccus aurantiacus]|uniref:AbrB/MazE/SpoVT family DNA-binding domain-containing protein n=1 Tax=Pistricoccus aurantiacus TaxID=1883414 RepID=A0A5B8SPE1_9GAMM|nr:AbrB/MazE/SpoVT family DNA-binding domain-containing protein [Pistricoccus aurantiacus]QEA38181.1 AbrB/MazE/SpoVT family DNA-binding domain-containing protein [Pistricoccus aurantiacus]